MAEPHLRTRTLRLSVVEGSLAAAMIGLGEFWFVADAVRLGAGPLVLGLLVTLPQLVGSLGSVAMLRSLRTARTRRTRVVAAVLGQAGVLVVLSALAGSRQLSPWLLVAAACGYHFFGQAAGNAWSSWFGELVPARVRGRYFGRRNRWVHGVTFMALALGGMLLQEVEPRAADAAGAGGLGFAILYGVAAVFRAGSAVLLLRSWEPPFTPPQRTDRLRTALAGPENRAARGVVLAGGFMLLAVCLGSPFFSPFMLGELRFSYTTYLVAQGFVVGAKVLALPLWGRAVDRFGPRAVYRVAVLLIAVIPLPWIVAQGPGIVFAAQALSGVAWAASEVGLLTLTLAAAPPRKRSVLLAAQSLTNGVAQFVGGLLGALLLTVLPGRFVLLFAITAAARLLGGLLVPLWLEPSSTPRPPLPVGRVFAWLPHGGLARRLVFGPEE